MNWEKEKKPGKRSGAKHSSSPEKKHNKRETIRSSRHALCLALTGKKRKEEKSR